MLEKLKQKIKNKNHYNQSGEEIKKPSPEQRKRRRLHTIYALIIINLILWTINYVQLNNFYQNYTKLLIKNAGASKIEQQEDKKNISSSNKKREEMSVREYVLNEVKKAGLDPKKAEMIIQCESGWEIWQDQVNNNGSIDRGLWQINSIHNFGVENSYNYKKATDWAIQKRLHDGNWSAWTCAKKLNLTN